MKVAIHQPHYFPWLGYFDKIAKVDLFVIMDQVQFVPRSYMCRNSFVNRNGTIEKLTVTTVKKGYQSKQMREIEVLDCKIWQNKHKAFFHQAYRYFSAYGEIMERISPILENDYVYLIDVLMDTISAIQDMLDITTKTVMQHQLEIAHEIASELPADKAYRQCMDIIDICIAVGATYYITGRGKSLEFVDPKLFETHRIRLDYQNYTCPVYDQKFTEDFIPNISALDLLFNCGINKSREIFWKNIKST